MAVAVRTFVLSVLTVLALLLAPVTLGVQPAAQAVDRVEVTCGDGFDCAEAELQKLVTDAGSTPTRIALGLWDVNLTKTLKIPAGADIELAPPEQDASFATETRIVRQTGFSGTMIEVEKGAK